MAHSRQQSSDATFGTFGGVFTPCTLTILGVIMFLRFGQVVGNAGVLAAVLIVLLSKSITLLTTLSLSAIATNTRVKGGGAYYLISRSLGVESGGAIGVVFYLAQAIVVALYVIGFSEAFLDAFPGWDLSLVEVATVVNIAVFGCAYVGADWAIKVQYAILGLLLLAMASFYVGAVPQFELALLRENWDANYAGGEDFFTMFALFFPAVTGIMAGANLSGDLKDPSWSIPVGTLAAIAFTGLVYVSLAVVLGGIRSGDVLITDTLVMKDAARLPALVSYGVFAATLSSALASMMGAPRVLQAMARDRIFPGLKGLAVGSGPNDEPRRAIVLTFFIAQTAILLGDLNAIAPVITMAFMITYGLINVATLYEQLTRNPSFRPRFRFTHWSVSLLGAAGCGAVMCLIAPLWACGSLIVVAALHWSISRREIQARWGDVRRGVLFERARRNLLKLEEELYHPKNWRPVILVFSGASGQRAQLDIYGHWLAAGRGVLTIGQVVPGEMEDHLEQRGNQERLLRQFIRDEELEAFPAVVVASSVAEGIQLLLQGQGVGSMRPNTVLFGFPRDPDRIESFSSTLRIAAGLGQSLVILRFGSRDDDLDGPRCLTDDLRQPPSGTIDVWWRGGDNGTFMLMLAHLLAQNSEWRSHHLRLLRVIPAEAGRQDVLQHLRRLLTTFRIDAEPIVLVADDAKASVHTQSREAAVVFLGCNPPADGGEAAFWDSLDDWCGPLERVIFVHGTGDVALEA